MIRYLQEWALDVADDLLIIAIWAGLILVTVWLISG